ncbi:GNAT family N-acetyltransferase [Sporomusa malonica]|uniref:Acetyltransferase (GNAT) family protein n=1 Tax=Sporomusa malonica TaxID=112901 RepID=A0A1W2BHV3_9FIRM|nr:GNAT family N-acetyltransferase [Sporomusa malonica]SMC72523.1 Acetyltransferase (GNAT) family protein [Sporomusa malonica]
MNNYTITRARAADIEGIACLFTESFIDSVLHHCGGRLPKPQAMQDVFSLVYAAEPEAALIAKDRAGQLIGYCFAPVRLNRLWLKAITGGHLVKWAWRWLTGKYGFGLHPVKVILLNKLAFLRSAATPGKTANARILSIAVSPAARGLGVASALMAQADNYFRENHVTRVRLEVRPDNRPAIRVYEKLGYYAGGTTYDSQGPWLIMFKEIS